MSLLSLCNKTVTLERATYTDTESGGRTVSYAAVYADLPVSMQPASGRIIERLKRQGIEVDYVFYTPVSVETQIDDRILHDGAYYLVTHSGDMAGRGRGWAIYTKYWK